MSDARETNEDEAGKTAPQKTANASHLIVVVLAMVITVLGAIGGVVFWLTRTGRLPVQAAAGQVQAAARPEPPKTRLMALEPLLVNLSDAGGNGYLRVAVVLRIEDPAPAKGDKPKEEKPAEKGKPAVSEDEVRMRDAALDVLGRETSDRLLAAEGKERLKSELREAFATHVPQVKVTDILYTEFLVQR